MRLFLICTCLIVSGCINFTPEVHATKQWENHYMSVEAFTNGTLNIILDKNESIWVLSNSTLSRLLKNTTKGSGKDYSNAKK